MVSRDEQMTVDKPPIKYGIYLLTTQEHKESAAVNVVKAFCNHQGVSVTHELDNSHYHSIVKNKVSNYPGVVIICSGLTFTCPYTFIDYWKEEIGLK